MSDMTLYFSGMNVGTPFTKGGEICHRVKIKYNTPSMCSSCLFFTNTSSHIIPIIIRTQLPFTGYRRIGRVLEVGDVYPGSFGAMFYLGLPV